MRRRPIALVRRRPFAVLLLLPQKGHLKGLPMSMRSREGFYKSVCHHHSVKGSQRGLTFAARRGGFAAG